MSPACIVESPLGSPVKKPSYLNLACCVNGYSNLTTYDSKLRQNINKSREVSPIRPATNNNLPSQNHRLSGNFLAVPLTSYGHKSASSSPSSREGAAMENRHIFTQVQNVDTTDNVGSDIYFKSSKFISTTNLKGDLHENDTSKTTKSFIQQRVERLYGPGALAQGFYSPKKTRSQELSILSERSSNSQVKFSSSKTITTFEREITSSSTTINGKTTMTSSSSLDRTTVSQGTGNENCENIQNGGGLCDLPVLRHLRPEFRAQLPIMSPKRSPNKFSLNESSSCPVLQNGTSGLHINGASNGNGNLSVNCKVDGNDKQKTGTAITVHYIADTETPKKHSSQMNGSANNSLTSDGKIIAPNSAPAVGSADKSSSDMKIFSEKLTQEKSECDKLSSLKQQSLDTEATGKTCQSGINAMTVEVTHSSPNLTHDIPDKSAGPLLVPVTVPSQTTDKYSEENGCSSNNVTSVRDGNYFLQILKTEQDRLLALADQAEKELETLLASSTCSSTTTATSTVEVSDDVLGYLRSASGKARLLVSQKMKQFEGLCRNNLNQLPDEKFPTTNEDLQGFWDMVMLQVAHVDSLFKEIETLKANNWKKPVQQVPSAPQGSKLTRRPNTAKSSSSSTNATTTNGNAAAAKKTNASSLAAQRREAQRKQLMELKRKNKLAMSAGEQQQPNQNQVVEIFVNEQSNS